MKSYLSTPLEVRAALSGELSRLFVPVKPQPDPPRAIYNDDECIAILGKKELTHDNTGLLRFSWRTERFYPKIYTTGSVWSHQAPYPPESLIYFREAIADDGFNGPLFPYYVADKVAVECDFKAKIWDRVGDKPYKISAQQMPEEAARIYAKLGEPTVELVDGIWNWAYPVTVISTTGKP